MSSYKVNIPLLIEAMYLVYHSIIFLFIELINKLVTQLSRVIIGSSHDVHLLMSASGVIL